MTILHLQERTSKKRPSSQSLDTPVHCLSGALAMKKGSVMLAGTWGVSSSGVMRSPRATAPISSSTIKNNIISFLLICVHALVPSNTMQRLCCRLSTLAMTSAFVVLSLIKLTSFVWFHIYMRVWYNKRFVFLDENHFLIERIVSVLCTNFLHPWSHWQKKNVRTFC
jgi:hypothetical protein